MSLDALIAGMLHPLFAPTHALALLAVALLIGRQRRRRLQSAAFAAALAAGLAAIAHGFAQTWAVDVLLAAAALGAGLVAFAAPVPTPICVLLAAIVGASLGLDSPPQVIALATATVMLIGTGLGGCLALALVAAGASRLTRDWQRIGVRILGSWIAASAMLVLALRYVRGMLF